MLTGEPPFTGASAQAILARVLTEHPPPVTRQRRTVPANVEGAVARALEKLPADRFETAAEFSEALLGQGPTRTTRTIGAAKPVSPAARRTWRIVATVAIVASALALWGWFRPEPPPPVRRYSMGIPPNQTMQQTVLGINLALSPDGNQLVYLGPGDGGGQLWLRDRDKLDATPIAGTNGALDPFFSPDGKQIAFSTGAVFDLKVIPVGGGPAVTIAQPGPDRAAARRGARTAGSTSTRPRAWPGSGAAEVNRSRSWRTTAPAESWATPGPTCFRVARRCSTAPGGTWSPKTST